MTAEDDFYALKYSFDSVPTRPIIDFEESSRPDSPTTSKLCGTPYLPEHAPYPEYDDEPVFFIASSTSLSLNRFPVSLPPASFSFSYPVSTDGEWNFVTSMWRQVNALPRPSLDTSKIFPPHT